MPQHAACSVRLALGLGDGCLKYRYDAFDRVITTPSDLSDSPLLLSSPCCVATMLQLRAALAECSQRTVERKLRGVPHYASYPRFGHYCALADQPHFDGKRSTGP